MTTDTANMYEGGEGRMHLPVAAFLLEHPHATLVFDTGMHPELEHTKERMGATASMYDVSQSPGWTLTGQLEAVGVAPEDVDVAVLSHLHFDHAGGVAQLPEARLVVQRDEWAAAFDEVMVGLGVFNPADFDLGHQRQEVDGEHDLFGDGSLVLVPTPGHTAGHQSLLVEGRLLLVGDACYCQVALDRDALPPFPVDAAQQRQAFAWLRAQQAAGIEVVYSHDPDQWAHLGPVV